MRKVAGEIQKVRTQHFTAGFEDDGREAWDKECGHQECSSADN